MFRLLGLMAALDLRLNRIRINFVPLNLALAGLLIWGVALGVTRAADGPAAAVPRTVTVADLAAGRVPSGTFVSVSGLVEPDLVLELGKRGADGKMSTVKERLQLLHDASTPAVWLRRSAVVQFGGRATFTGIVRPLPEAARRATANEQEVIGRRAPSMAHLLEDGARPRSFAASLVYLAICAPPLALLAWVWISRREIFRAGHHGTADQGSPHEPIDLRVSGRLRLDNRTSRRFVEMAAELRQVVDGGLAVVADIDASSYVMGVRAVGREGLWTVRIPAGSALAIVEGAVAFGAAVRPAARVDIHVGGRVSERMTLTFGSVAQRDRVLAFLRSVFVAQRAAA
jgi:hypothetical protein